MVKKILFLLFVLSFSLCNAQGKEQRYPFFSKAKHYQYSNKDSAYFYFQKAIDRQKQKRDIDDVLAIYTFLIGANSYYFDLVPLKKNIDAIDKILEQNKGFLNVKLKVFYSRYQLFARADYFYKLGEYEKSEKYFQQLYRELKAIPPEKLSLSNIDYISLIQSYLGNIYFLTGKTNLAKSYYSKDLKFSKLHKESNPDWKKDMAITRLSLVAVYNREKEYTKAKNILIKAINFLDDLPANRRYVISAYHLLANNYLLQNKPDSAIIVLDKVTKKNLIAPTNLWFLITQLQYKARAYVQKNDFDAALNYYEEALAATKKYRGTNIHPDMAELYADMGDLYANNQKFNKSLAYYQKALGSLSKNFKNKKINENPDPKRSISKLRLINVLSGKLEILMEAYHTTARSTYLKAALTTGKSTVKTLEALKPEFESKVDMQFLVEETFPSFERMIEAAFLLYQKTGEAGYMRDAFHFSEKSKAVLLLSAVQSAKVTKFAGVPDSIVAREQQYLAKINHLEKKHFKNPDDNNIEAELFQWRTDFYAFLNGLETRYPKYHALKAKTRAVTLGELKNLLRPEEAMLSYYAGKDVLYCFLIENKDVTFKSIPFPNDFSEKIVRLQKLLSSPSVTKIDELKKLGDQVRRKLLPEIGPSISTLLIVRSGVLNYIPFGALYNSKEKKYLIEEYAVSYANSATLYQEYAQGEKPGNHRLLAFAPSFGNAAKTPGGARSGLGPLLYNKKEVQLIGNYFDGKLLLNKEASLQAFEKEAQKFSILHLATHAIVNDQFSDYSYLAFAPSPKDSVPNLLYIKDLYNYDLNVDLVTLSACKTGIGKLQKGAGMLSLARGFNYAGASSIVTTQWEINDRSAASLMNGFYKNLSQGQAKNTALRNAKLTYLKTTDDPMQRHPYFWAGFVLTGNTSPLVETSDWYLWAGTGLVLFLLILGVYFRKRLFSIK